MPTWLERTRRGVDRSLFPRASGPPAPVWAVVLVALLGAVAIVARLGPAATFDAIWAEDGRPFLTDAARLPLGDALVSTYRGYVHVLPRLAAGAVTALPVAWWAAGMASIAVALAGAAAATVFVASEGHLPDVGPRLLLAALVVLVPSAGHESLASVAYVHWYLLFASVWVVLWRPRTTWGAAWGGLLLLLTGASTPVLVALTPLLVARWLVRADRRDVLIVSGGVLAVVLQFTVVTLTPYDPPVSGDLLVLGRAWLVRVVAGTVPGPSIAGAWWRLAPALVYAWAVLVVATTLGAVTARWRSPAAAVAGVALVASVGLFVASGITRGLDTAFLWSGTVHANAARYTIVPGLLLASALVVLTANARSRRVRRTGLGVVTAVLLLAVATNVVQPGARQDVRWSDRLASARQRCATSDLEVVEIPIAPPGLSLDAPCGRVGPS